MMLALEHMINSTGRRRWPVRTDFASILTLLTTPGTSFPEIAEYYASITRTGLPSMGTTRNWFQLSIPEHHTVPIRL